MVAYLQSAGLKESAVRLKQESNLGDHFDDTTAKKYESLLEKKWTSVVRLQKRIMDLELKNKELQTELDTATPLSSSRKLDPSKWLPKAPAKHTLVGHRGPVISIAFHPTYTSLASASEDATIKIWDWELGELEMTLKGHTKPVLDVDFGGPRGGTLLASCSSDLTIKLWDPSDSYKNIRTLPGHDHSISCVRFIPSGAAGAPLSGNMLASASRDKDIRIWDVTTGYCLRTLKGHTDWVRNVASTCDGRWLLSCGNDSIPRLWDLNAPAGSSTECRVTFLGHEHTLEAVAFAPSTSYSFLAQLAGYKKAPPISSSGEFLASGGRDKIIKIWDNRGTCVRTLVGHDNWIRGLLFHPAGKYLLSVSDDKTIRCWDLSQECKCVRVVEGVHDHFVSSLRWAPDVPQAVEANSGTNGLVNGRRDGPPPKDHSETGGKIRCVIATGSVDQNVRIFAG